MTAPERGRLLFGLVALALLVGALGGWAVTGSFRRAMAFPQPGRASGASIPLSDAGRRIASGFQCPCGCPDLLLSCNCPNPRGAAEVKRLINDLVLAGRSESDVRIELINRYGGAIQKGRH